MNQTVGEAPRQSSFRRQHGVMKAIRFH